MTPSGIILQNVSFAYGDRTVLQDFSLTLPGSGVTALCGPSGCGKTTLLRLLAGLEQPADGIITAPPPGQTAILFQEDRLLPALNAAAQISIVLPPGADALPWLAAADLAAEAHTLPQEMSGGMRRRLALARCLAYARGKALILLDEPFTGIDPQRAGQIMQHIRALHIPVIYTAHDAHSLSLADKVIHLGGPPLHPL